MAHMSDLMISQPFPVSMWPEGISITSYNLLHFRKTLLLKQIYTTSSCLHYKKIQAKKCSFPNVILKDDGIGITSRWIFYDAA